MRFEPPLVEARLVRRYKRFLADVVFPGSGQAETVHCPNTGRLAGCQPAGARIWLSRARNPRRKYRWTWELVETEAGELVGINTGRANTLVREALEQESIGMPVQYGDVQTEVRAPDMRSRFDFQLRGPAGTYYLEVKNVTAAVTGGEALFPDAASARAARHALELARLRRAGYGAGMLFCIQRADVQSVRPADEIDPAYGHALREAAAAGVDLLAFRARVSPEGIALGDPVEVRL